MAGFASFITLALRAQDGPKTSGVFSIVFKDFYFDLAARGSSI